MVSSRPKNSIRGGKVPLVNSLRKSRRKTIHSKGSQIRATTDLLGDVVSVRRTREASSRRVKRRAKQSSMRLKRSGATLPDLQAIFDTFAEALAITQAAHMAAKQADHWGPPEVALGKGIEMLKHVYSELDGATTDLAQFERKQLKAARAALLKREIRRGRP
jgi:hypothetical protein